MRRFEGQSVFVTGGNKGIGYGIARRFAEEGAKVAIASVDKDTNDAAKKLADETGSVTHGVILDVRDAAAVREAYGAAEEAIGPLSISVQNACCHHHLQDRGAEAGTVGFQPRCQHQGRVPVLPGSDPPLPRKWHQGPPG